MQPSLLSYLSVAFYSLFYEALISTNRQSGILLPIKNNVEHLTYGPNNNNGIYVLNTAGSDPSLAPLPGLPRLASGLDITKLDLTNKGGGSAAGFRTPVLQFTFNQKKMFVDDAQGIRHLIPDQVQSAYPVPAGQFQATTIISKSEQEWAKSTLLTLGLGAGPAKLRHGLTAATNVKTDPTSQNSTSPLQSVLGMLSGSLSYKSVKKVTKDESKSFISTQSTINSFKYDFSKQNSKGNGIAVTDDFLADLALLPNVQGKLSDVDFSNAYEGFIGKYGTHYFGGVLFGGKLDLTTITDSYLHKTLTDDQLRVQLGIAFMNKAASFGYETNTTASSSEFMSKSTSTFEFLGGQAPVMTDVDGKPNYKSWQDWTVSVFKDPWMLQAELQPLSQLIPDPAVRDILQHAIDAYLFKAYLTDLADTLSQNVGKWDAFYDIERSLIQSIRMEVSKPLLQVNINYDKYEAPGWFKQDVKLCYETTTSEPEKCPDFFKTSGCVGLNEWATIMDEQMQFTIWQNYSTPCKYQYYRLYLKTIADVDFVQNGCFIDPTAAPKPCNPTPSDRPFRQVDALDVHKGQSSYDPVLYITRQYIFPGSWVYQYSPAVASNSFLSALAICFNHQDPDPRVKGVDRSSRELLYCTPLNKSLVNNNKVEGFRQYLSFSLRDMRHAV